MAGQVMSYTPGNAWSNAAVSPGSNSSGVAIDASPMFVTALGECAVAFTFKIQYSVGAGFGTPTDGATRTTQPGQKFSLADVVPGGGQTHMRLQIVAGTGNITATMTTTVAG